jgi:UDP-N-acetylmuramoylalanine--D-glutamate ligase
VKVRGKKILIFGLGRSGVGAANLLADAGADVTVTDRKPEEDIRDYVQRLSPSVKRCLGGYPERMNGTDLVVVSPGVPLEIGPLAAARDRGIKIIGELELAYAFLQEDSRGTAFPFLAITGSNGKSTTTTLLDMMLRKGGFKTLLGGNIGNALTEEILKSTEMRRSGNAEAAAPPPVSSPGTDFVVVEVSSFQLESIDTFKPAGAAILNITPDHLDRYHSMDEYSDAKAAIFRNQDERDFLVLNADDPETMRVYRKFARGSERPSTFPKTFFFSRKSEVEGVYCRNGTVHFNGMHHLLRTSSSPLMGVDEIRIKGVHNLENAMAASAMALLAGCSPEAVTATLREFSGLEHRMELVRELEGVKYVNDSKGTNVGAVMKSLEGFLEPVILIAGGRDKAGDFAQLRPLVREKVKELILIGEAAEKIRAALGDLTKTLLASDLHDAIEKARKAAQKGDVVLLSPACASFDMFRDFEDRGHQFKMLVGRLS